MTAPEPTESPALADPQTYEPDFDPSALDAEAVKVVRKLLNHGYEAYVVGGCVRDLCLGLQPKDFDVATSATPEQIHRLFRNSRVIGRRFRLAHVFFGAKNIETSTFRTTPLQSDDEDLLVTHDNVWGTVQDDARRRDFTINALFFDVERSCIVDFTGGYRDLSARLIRTIGDPRVRFREDPVRMIRAIKFAARLGFRIEDEAWQALNELAPELARCSRARLLEELYKLLRGGAAAPSLAMLRDTGLLAALWPSYLEAWGRIGGVADGAEPWTRFCAALAVLDDYVGQTGHAPPNPVLVAALFAPLVDGLLGDGAGRELEGSIEELMRIPAIELGIARRDREQAASALAARLRGPSLPARRLDRDALLERLLVLAIHAGSSGRPELAEWLELAIPAELEARSTAGGGKRRRGRRRRAKPSNGRGGERAGAGASALRPASSES